MANDELRHYGTPRHSGRYPWGSGENPYQRNSEFRQHIDKMRKRGMNDTDIARSMGMTTTEMRKRISLAKNEEWSYLSAEAVKLKDKGYSNQAIADRLGRSEAGVRLLLNNGMKERNNRTKVNADILKDAVDSKGYIDIGAGTEIMMGIKRPMLANAVKMLEDQGYVKIQIPVEQLGTGKDTNVMVLAKPGTTWGEVKRNADKIGLVTDVYSEDGGQTLRKLEPPRSVDSSRIEIRYKEDGGEARDGLIELRRGVDDISLGEAKYAQVRIAVDGTHYLKGMAMYSDDLPDGVDIRFNTNKHEGTPMMGPKDNTVLKPMSSDPDNPFGATIRPDDKLIRAQRHYFDENGKEQLSCLNIVNEEGNWNSWSKSLSTQFLSKQSPALAKQQLEISLKNAREEFDEIMKLTNPTVRASLLNKFAGQCDSDAVHMDAAALPRQATKVLLPFTDIKDGECYCPTLRDGETVALVRYPHAGTFEIPVLTVNNKMKSVEKSMGNAIDAIGINHKAAEQLSGADFDGDSVLCIPIDHVNVRTRSQLRELEGFNPSESYPKYPGMKVMDSRTKGLEMGKVSNLITDMTIQGATDDELVRAVKHSMVVIDAEKHELNWKQSELDNRIGELKEKYQGGANRGAATLISRGTSDKYIPQRKEKPLSRMTPEERKRWREGEMIYEETGKRKLRRIEGPNGEITWDRNGPLRTETVAKGAYYDDAFKLVSKTPETTTRIERIYAEYANSMKALAKQARKEARRQQDVPYDPSAAKAYSQEVRSLKAKLELALSNAPLERQAQLIANKNVAIKKREAGSMDHEHLKRLKGQELDAARRKVGAHKEQIYITDRQWEAISAGAVSPTRLKSILENSDPRRVRELATPRTAKGLSTGRIAQARSLLGRGYTQAEVADQLGVSVSTLQRALE